MSTRRAGKSPATCREQFFALPFPPAPQRVDCAGQGSVCNSRTRRHPGARLNDQKTLRSAAASGGTHPPFSWLAPGKDREGPAVLSSGGGLPFSQRNLMRLADSALIRRHSSPAKWCGSHRHGAVLLAGSDKSFSAPPGAPPGSRATGSASALNRSAERQPHASLSLRMQPPSHEGFSFLFCARRG